jgi:hypothetical protein
MNTKNLLAGLILIFALALFSGCNKGWHNVEGNYNVVTETRYYSGFDRVINEGDFDVYIIQDGSDEVSIEAESNLIPLIRTRIEGSALVIDTKDNLRNNYPMKVFVHLEDVREIKLSGSGLMQAENIEAEDLDVNLSGSGSMFISGIADVTDCQISGSGSIDLGMTCNEIEADISGSGDIEIWGTADQGDFKISGSGSIHAYDLTLQDCHAKISGSGSMYLTVEDYLYVNISGSGDVWYLGNPIIDTDISGSGSIIHP